MKKVLKISGITLGLLFLLVLALAIYVNFAPAPSYTDVPIPDLTVEITPEKVAQGHLLVMNNCQGCHGAENGTLEGQYFEDMAANLQFGDIYTSNITQHETAGIGTYTDGELYRLLRTGVKRNGQLATVVMPRWMKADDEDLHAIIAFLRSDHKMVQPSEKVHPAHQSSFLEKALSKIVFAPSPYPAKTVTKPSLEADPIAYGAYQVHAVNLCYYCHSADIAAANPGEPEKTPRYLAGGYTFLLEHDQSVPVPGLLPSSNEDIAQWSEEEFVQAVKYGIRPGKPAYQRPMHPFQLDSTEVSAIYQYLQVYSK